MKAILVSFALIVTAACGGSGEFTTAQGVLVEDQTGTLTRALVETAIQWTMDFAPEAYHPAFAQLDGYTLYVLTTRTVDACRVGSTEAIGCVDVGSQSILIGNNTCANYRGMLAILAHEIGHIVIEGHDKSHANDDWYARMGVSDQVARAECGDRSPIP